MNPNFFRATVTDGYGRLVCGVDSDCLRTVVTFVRRVLRASARETGDPTWIRYAHGAYNKRGERSWLVLGNRLVASVETISGVL